MSGLSAFTAGNFARNVELHRQLRTDILNLAKPYFVPPRNQRLALYCLATYATASPGESELGTVGGDIYPTRPAIAKQTDLSEKSVYNAITALKVQGTIAEHAPLDPSKAKWVKRARLKCYRLVYDPLERSRLASQQRNKHHAKFAVDALAQTLPDLPSVGEVVTGIERAVAANPTLSIDSFVDVLRSLDSDIRSGGEITNEWIVNELAAGLRQRAVYDEEVGTG